MVKNNTHRSNLCHVVIVVKNDKYKMIDINEVSFYYSIAKANK